MFINVMSKRILWCRQTVSSSSSVKISYWVVQATLYLQFKKQFESWWCGPLTECLGKVTCRFRGFFIPFIITIILQGLYSLSSVLRPFKYTLSAYCPLPWGMSPPEWRTSITTQTLSRRKLAHTNPSI